jgi:hypothetical protein
MGGLIRTQHECTYIHTFVYTYVHMYNIFTRAARWDRVEAAQLLVEANAQV